MQSTEWNHFREYNCTSRTTDKLKQGRGASKQKIICKLTYKVRAMKRYVSWCLSDNEYTIVGAMD